ncbi:MAG: hypothetical protein ACQERS_14430 [Bacteroidota bacterium]
MKRALLILTILVIAIQVYGQVRMPNKPYVTLNSKRGYITVNEFTFGVGWADDGTSYSQGYLGFTTLHAFQSSEKLLTGGATGLLYYNDGILIPLYGEVRANLKISVMVPYVSASAGFLINPSDFIAGSKTFISPALGVMSPLSEHVAVNISGGYLLQMSVNDGNANFVTGKAGIIYKF